MLEDKFLNLEYQRTKFIRFLDSLPEKEKARALKALFWAEQGHQNQFRDSGVLYIIHPLRSTLILVEELGIQDNRMLCASLMHDLVEDSGYTIEHIESQFGRETARLVKGATRTRPENETEEEKLRDKPKKFKEIAESDKNLRLIKLCDILDNMRAMEYIPETHINYPKISRWKNELKEYVLPIAENTNEKLYNLLSQFSD
ncbi:HD domain-containing protein [Patescibacteria group bacterium]|nr:HD domain-containing protein [Patescibacteria group bacterium]MBU4022957.1 HD domain-containing protein [Patescibacteria group bacterium]MBU4078084.1 HD domain-containing protein [Patescibacteria group bacterium]